MFDKIVQKAKQTKSSLNFAQKFFRLAADPNDTIRVFDMQDALMEIIGNAGPEGEKKGSEMLRSFPEIERMLNEQYFPPKYNVEELAHYPVGTLGYAYYRHMHDNGFSPDFFPPVKLTSDFNYFGLRMRQTHDIWHVLTGFGTDIPNEVGLQAFYLAQFNAPLATSIIAATLLYCLKHPETLHPLMEDVVKGYEMGKQARLIAVNWEKHWDMSLEEIRREYNIKPFSTIYDFQAEPELTAAR